MVRLPSAARGGAAVRLRPSLAAAPLRPAAGMCARLLSGGGVVLALWARPPFIRRPRRARRGFISFRRRRHSAGRAQASAPLFASLRAFPPLGARSPCPEAFSGGFRLRRCFGLLFMPALWLACARRAGARAVGAGAVVVLSQCSRGGLGFWRGARLVLSWRPRLFVAVGAPASNRHWMIARGSKKGRPVIFFWPYQKKFILLPPVINP